MKYKTKNTTTMKKEVKIKSFEDACKLLKRNPKLLPVVKGLPKDEAEYITATFKLSIITKALNFDQQTGKEWKPDFTDNNYKYWPYFWVKTDKKQPSGFGFSDCVALYWYGTAVAPSRLCFKTRELALYATKTFEKLYLKVYLF